jgi:hypothetical protein
MKPQENRKPGRSFDDPSQPMGKDIVERASDVGANLEGGVYGRAEDGAKDTGVADRAKAVSVLRKAEEFIATNNPSNPRRALELAAGRVGLTYEEYRRIVDADHELRALEAKFLGANPH